MMLREKFPYGERNKEDLFVNCEDIKQVYIKIGDDYSRKIFANRCMYSFTGDYGYIGNIVAGTETGKSIQRLLNSFESIYIYGAGVRGKLLAETFTIENLKGFIDLNKSGSYMNYPIFYMKDFQYEDNSAVFISNVHGCNEIIQELTADKHVPEEKIFLLNDFIAHMDDNIYVEPRYLTTISMKNKVFLDLGCFDGKDAKKAADCFSEDNVSVYAFEPDEDNYKICVSNLQKYGNKINIQNKGIGCKKEKKCFAGGGAGARFSEQGTCAVDIDTIDNLMGDQDVGIIKMDIEGYEELAILGGTATIKRCKPVLAVSLYHKKSDIWRIPLKILEIDPGYQFYLEHYTFGWNDTVLYAIAR